MRLSTVRGAIAGLALALTAGAVPARAADQVTLLLNWFPLADHAPYYLGKKKGYYGDEHIELSIVRGQGSGDTATKVGLGQAEFGISDTPTVLTAISKGAELTIVGIIYDKAANNVFFYKDSGIADVEELKGKSIAAPPGDSHRFLWPALAKQHGMDPDSVNLVNVKPEGKQAIVAARRADAAFDLYTNFPVWEKVLGEGNVGNLLFADNGVQLYGHGFIVNRATVRDDPDLIRRFLRASYKAWADTYREREAAVDALMAEVAGIDRAIYLENLDLVLDLVVTERSREHGLGWIAPELMQETIDITASGGQMGEVPALDAVFTNEYNSKVPAPQ